jgi:diketogulonate reductase-like aldo/keto reductase
MIYKEFGKTREKLSALGLGTWQLGRDPMIEIKAIRAGIDAGINFIDTAEIYGSEPIVKRALQGKKNIFIATKVWPTHFHYDDVIKSCNQSLHELGLNKIDLYQLHWPNKFIPIEETMRAMEDLVKEGKIKYIGVSNFDKDQLINAQSVMKKEEIVSNQVEYSIVVREPEKTLIPYCKKEKISIIAYSPLGHGKLFSSRYKPLLDALSVIGKPYKKTATQVALNWLLNKKEIFPIPKVSTPEHALEDAASASFKIKPKDKLKIEIKSQKFGTSPLRNFVYLPLSFLLFFKRF